MKVKRIMRIQALIVILILISAVTSGCYWKNEVQASEVGLSLEDGVSISEILPAGRYSDGSWYAQLRVIDVSNKTAQWSDPSLVTSDKQPISLTLAVTYSRCRSDESVTSLFSEFRAEAFNDESLQTLVFSRIPSAAKQITTLYTLDQMLGIAEGEDAVGRAAVENELRDILGPELLEVYVCLSNVTVADIGVDQDYLDALAQKAQAQVLKEVAAAEADRLGEQLIAEQKQTDIDLEIARRENLINEELAKAYELSPALVDIRKLELLADILGENDMIIYVPEGSDISTVLLGNEAIP